MDIIPDIWEFIICPYLTNKDCISLHLANILPEKVLHNKIIKNVLNKLKLLFKNHYQIVLKLLKENAISITGSFILECILDETYNGDIDLCLHENLKSECKQFLNSINYFNLKFVKKYPNTYPSIHIEFYKLLSEIIEFNYGHYWGKKVQFILLKSHNYQDYLDTFDLDVCKNLFHYNKEKGAFEFYIYNLRGIYEKNIDVCSNKSFTNRIIKYCERGFKILNSNYEIFENVIRYHGKNIWNFESFDENYISINCSNFDKCCSRLFKEYMNHKHVVHKDKCYNISFDKKNMKANYYFNFQIVEIDNRIYRVLDRDIHYLTNPF